MTSKLIVNSLAADTGVSTITFADQAKMGNAIFHSTGFTIGDSFLHSTGVNITNINATGVITATKFVGEVSVGSSITFEDNEKAYFGTGTDFSIYHNGSASYLDETGTGGLIAKTNTAFQVFNSAGSQAALTVTPGAAVELYYNTTKVLETKGYGIDITGGFVATGDCSIADKITHSGDLNTAIRFPAADQISFETGGTNRLKIHTYSSNNHVELDSSTHLSFADNGSNGRFIYMGDANASSTGYMHLQPGAGSQGFGGGIRLYSHANSTNPGGVYIGKSLNSNGAIIFGNGGMTPSTEFLRITHQGRIGLNGVVPTSSHANVTSSIHLADSNTILSRTGNQYFALYQNLKQTSADVTRYLVNGYASAYVQHTGTHRFYTVGNGTGNTNATVTERLKINNNGLVLVNRDGVGGRIDATAGDASIKISDGNGRSSLKVSDPGSGNSYTWELTSAGNFKAPNGKGIDFSATSDAGGMDNELLDDYEEGSWTPTSRNDGSFTSSSGRYVKIGQKVTVWGFIPTVTNNTSNNILQCSGLPFTVASGGCSEYVGTLMIRFVTAVSGQGVSFVCYTYAGRDYVEFYACRDDGNNYEAVKHSELHYTNSNGIRFCLTYVV